MSTEVADLAAVSIRSHSASPATVRSVWLTAAGRSPGVELLSWPPDMFAFTDVVLDRTEAYRFAVSPPADRE